MPNRTSWMRRIAFAALGLQLALASGCGAIQAATIYALVPDDDDDVIVSGEPTPALPAAVVEPIPREKVLVPIAYRLLDENSDALAATFEYSTDAGATFSPASIASGSPDGTSGLASSPQGTRHVFLWDKERDLGPTAFDRVKFRVTPNDGGGGFAGVSPGLGIVGNDAPTVAIQAVEIQIDPSDSKLAKVTVIVADSTSDVTELAAEWTAVGSSDLVNFPVGRKGAVTVLAGSVSDLTTTPGGVARTFVWNLVNDFQSVQQATLTLAITPRDSLDTGVPALFPQPVVWNRDDRPVAFFEFVDRQPAVVDADFKIVTVSTRSDVSIQVTFQIGDPDSLVFDPAATNFPATLLPPTTTTGLPGAPLGAASALRWDAPLDLLALGRQSAFVRLRLVPTVASTTAGPAAFSNGFIVGNSPPVAAIDPIPSPQGGVIPIRFSLTDATSDLASVAIAMSVSGGAFAAIPAEALVGPRANLGTSPAGRFHTVFWNAFVFPGPQTLSDVRVRVTPSDSAPGNAVDSNAFDVVIASQLAAAVFSPVQGQIVPRNPANIDVRLFEPQAGTADVLIEFSEGGGPRQLATLTPTANPVSGQTTSVSGASHVYTWDIVGNFVGRDVPAVTLFVTPSRPGEPGITGTAGPFAVNGNAEPEIANLALGAVPGTTVPIRFDVADLEATTPVTVSLTVTINPTFPADLAGTGTAPLVLSPPFGAVNVTWNARTQIAAQVTAANLEAVSGSVFVQARDGADPALSVGVGRTVAFSGLDVTAPPQLAGVAFDPPIVGTVFGPIGIQFTATDPDDRPGGGAIDVQVLVSLDGGANFTVAQTFEDVAVGSQETRSWLSNALIPGVEANVRVRLRAVDGDTGKPGVAVPVEPPPGPITVDNTPATAALRIVSLDQDDGKVTVGFIVGADTGIFVEFDLDAAEAPDFATATCDPDDGSFQAFAGPVNFVVWDARRDVAAIAQSAPACRLRLTDDFANAATTTAFRLDVRHRARFAIGADAPFTAPVGSRELHLDFGGAATSPLAADLARPAGIGVAFVLDAVAAAIPDPLNNRVLIFKPVPGTNFRAADAVLGQPDFEAHAPNRGLPTPTAETLFAPVAAAIESPGGRIAVSDAGNDRVLLYDFPTGTTAAATSAIGQVFPLDRPKSLAFFQGSLFVADRADGGRVLGFPGGNDSPTPATFAAIAVAANDTHLFLLSIVDDLGEQIPALQVFDTTLAPVLGPLFLPQSVSVEEATRGSLFTLNAPDIGPAVAFANPVDGETLVFQAVPGTAGSFQLEQDLVTARLHLVPNVILSGLAGPTAGGGTTFDPAGPTPSQILVADTAGQRVLVNAGSIVSGPPRVVINEVQPGTVDIGDGDDLHPEDSIEIFNRGPAAAVMGGFVLTDQDFTLGPRNDFTLPPFTLQPGEFALVTIGTTTPTAGSATVIGPGGVILDVQAVVLPGSGEPQRFHFLADPIFDEAGDDVLLETPLGMPIDYIAYLGNFVSQQFSGVPDIDPPPEGTSYLFDAFHVVNLVNEDTISRLRDGLDTDKATDLGIGLATLGFPNDMTGGSGFPPAPLRGDPFEVAIGQPSLEADAPLAHPPSSDTLLYPAGLAAWPDDTGPFALAVVDRGNHRVLVYETFPTAGGAPADLVLGQPDFTTGVPSNEDLPPEERLERPEGASISVAGNALFVTEAGVAGGTPGRVVRYAFGAPGAPPVATTFATGLTEPSGVRVVDAFNKLYVAERTGAVQIFDMASPASPVATIATFFDRPTGVDVYEPNPILAVADTGNDRVLLFLLDVNTGLPIDGTVFRTLGGGSTERARLHRPTGVYFAGERLFVADSGGSRVLVWHMVDVIEDGQDGIEAFDLIGQPRFDSLVPNPDGAPDDAGLSLLGLPGPAAVGGIAGTTLDGDFRLFVADPDNARALAFDDVIVEPGPGSGFGDPPPPGS